MYTVQELCDRYQLSSRNSLYSRINSLKEKGIEAEFVKYKGKSFADNELTSILDEQDKWLKNGGTLDNFERAIATSVSIVEPQYKEDEVHLEDGQDEISLGSRGASRSGEEVKEIAFVIEGKSIIDVARAIATEIAPYLPPRDPLWQLERLRWCAEEKMQLTTTQVKELIGVKPRGDRLIRGSFTFSRIGKIGRESAWRVENKSSF